jgi:hypothetical protein
MWTKNIITLYLLTMALVSFGLSKNTLAQEDAIVIDVKETEIQETQEQKNHSEIVLELGHIPVLEAERVHPNRWSCLSSIARFAESPKVKFVSDLLYDMATIAGVVLWAQTDPQLSQIGVSLCLVAQVPFGAIPRMVYNLNQIVNRPHLRASEVNENHIKEIVAQTIQQLQIKGQKGKKITLRICHE